MSKATNASTMSAAGSPTRRAVLSVGAAAVAASALPQAASAGNPWAPTELGLELMRRLPAFAAATYDRVSLCDCEGHPEYDAETVAAADEAEDTTSAAVDEAANAILRRPVTELAHLTDLAMVQFVYMDHYNQDDNPGGEAILTLIVELFDRGDVSLDACSPGRLYQKVKREREAA